MGTHQSGAMLNAGSIGLDGLDFDFSANKAACDVDVARLRL